MLKICFVSEKQVLSKCIAAAKTLNIYDSNKAVPLKRNNYQGSTFMYFGRIHARIWTMMNGQRYKLLTSPSHPVDHPKCNWTIHFPDCSVHLKYYVVKYFLLCEHICDVWVNLSSQGLNFIHVLYVHEKTIELVNNAASIMGLYIQWPGARPGIRG